MSCICCNDDTLMIAVDEAVIAMLDSGNHELLFAACGVLMNLMVDDEKRPKLLHHGGVSKYVIGLDSVLLNLLDVWLQFSVII